MFDPAVYIGVGLCLGMMLYHLIGETEKNVLRRFYKKNNRVTKEEAIIDREEERVRRILLCNDCNISGHQLSRIVLLMNKDVTIRCRACGNMATRELRWGH